MELDDRVSSWDDAYVRRVEYGMPETASLPAAQESIGSTSSSSAASPVNGGGALNMPSLVRTNFGKSRAYVPPPAAGAWHGYGAPPRITGVSSRKAKSPRPSSEEWSEMPFDQRGEKRSDPNRPVSRATSNNSRPFDEIDDSSPLPAPAAAAATTTRPLLSTDIRPPMRTFEHEEQARRYRVLPPRISSPLVDPPTPRNDFDADLSMDVNVGTPGRTNADASDEEDGFSNKYRGTAPHDSLFAFDEHETRRKRPKKVRPFRSRAPDTEDDEDDTSVEQVPEAELAARAHEAWKRKYAITAAASGPTDSKLSSSGPAVSFGHTDTVHHFQSEPVLMNDVETETFTGRSLNSEYTKSAESEVEDLIKDIFMIGSGSGNNPGRKKVKYNPQVKRKLRGDMDITDEETEETDDDVAPGEYSNGRSRMTRQSSSQQSGMICVAPGERTDDDPISSMWHMMEGGFFSLGTALGLDDGEADRRCSRSEDPGGLGGLFQFASDIFLGPSQDSNDREPPEDRVLKKSTSLEEDMRLVDLAVQAARSMHKLRGYEYDEGNEINIASDIKFCVIDLMLPLGLIFQENETGCWVTKILPGGHASKSELVQVGDQLAAVDGTSAINMKVDQIAKMIGRKPRTIELTLLRYVGPLCPAPGTIAEEGYEVNPLPSQRSRFVERAPERRRGKILGRRDRMGASPVGNLQVTATTGAKAPSQRQLLSKEASTLTRATASSLEGNSAGEGAKQKRRFWRFGRRNKSASK